MVLTSSMVGVQSTIMSTRCHHAQVWINRKIKSRCLLTSLLRRSPYEKWTFLWDGDAAIPKVLLGWRTNLLGGDREVDYVVQDARHVESQSDVVVIVGESSMLAVLP
jgi:hypothetical protein